MSQWNIGDSRSFSKTITDADIRAFAEISGDHNPIHLDEAYAAASKFGRRIAHGALITSFISNVIGNQIPGHGCIYLGSSFKFKNPTFIGDTVTATATIKSLRAERGLYVLECVCTNQDGAVLCEGESTVMWQP
jgi:3-hydroxybutyryl-CoA dehydratase